MVLCAVDLIFNHSMISAEASFRVNDILSIKKEIVRALLELKLAKLDLTDERSNIEAEPS